MERLEYFTFSLKVNRAGHLQGSKREVERLDRGCHWKDPFLEVGSGQRYTEMSPTRNIENGRFCNFRDMTSSAAA